MSASVSSFTGRMAVLVITVAAVALAVALPLKVYLGQRQAIERLQAQTRAQQQRVAQLQAQEQRWSDPGFVASQARDRLHFVLPGETLYTVLGGPPTRPGAAATPTSGATPATTTWYAQLWRSAAAAGR